MQGNENVSRGEELVCSGNQDGVQRPHCSRKVTSKSYLMKGNLDEAVGLLERCIPSNLTSCENQKVVTFFYLLL